MLPRRTAWSVALVATLTMAVSYVDRQTFATLAVEITRDLAISESQYGWLASAFSLAYLAATPAGGWWIDRAGARRGLVLAVLAWSAVAAMHGLAAGFLSLLALRIALGVAEGPSFPGSAQVVLRALPPAERARGFGVLFTGSSLGSMVVPPLAAGLYAIAGWRLACLGTALAGLVWVPLWLAVTRTRPVRAALDHASGGSGSAPAPPMLELLRTPAVLRAVLAIFAAAPVFGFALGWGAKYLNREFGVAQEDVGAYLWLPPLAFDAGAVLLGDLASRMRTAGTVGSPRLLVAVALPPAACLGLLPLAADPWQGVGLIAVAMAGGGGIYTLVTADLLSRVPPGSVSLASGLLAGGQSLALIALGPVLGAAVDATQSYDLPALALGLWVVPGTLAWLLWSVPPPAAAAPADEKAPRS